MVPEGGDFIFAQALMPKSLVARPPRSAADQLHVNSFDVKYRDDGSVEQFVSDLTVFDDQGREQLRKTITVNDPLRYQVLPPCLCLICCTLINLVLSVFVYLRRGAWLHADFSWE